LRTIWGVHQFSIKRLTGSIAVAAIGIGMVTRFDPNGPAWLEAALWLGTGPVLMVACGILLNNLLRGAVVGFVVTILAAILWAALI
jgi:hypothetical protein